MSRLAALTSRLENLVYGTRLAVPATLVALRLAAIGRPRILQSYHYKRRILQIIARTLRPDSNAIDIGSHRGLFLYPIVRHAPAGKHIALEPIPFLANRLRERFPTVDVRAVAVSDTNGTTSFFLDRRKPGYSALVSWEGHASSAEFIERIDVPVVTLDEIVPAERQIDLIKMDAMGVHVEILRGALRVIQRCRPVIIMYLRNAPGGEQPEQSAGRTWEILAVQGGMSISRLADWVAGRPALSRAQFLASVGRHEGSETCFVASPGESSAAA